MQKIKTLNILRNPSSSSLDTRRAILSGCSNDIIKFIGEVALNILEGHLPISRHYKKKLSTHADVIRSVGSRGVKPFQRKKFCISNPDVITYMLKATWKHLYPLIKHKWP